MRVRTRGVPALRAENVACGRMPVKQTCYLAARNSSPNAQTSIHTHVTQRTCINRPYEWLHLHQVDFFGRTDEEKCDFAPCSAIRGAWFLRIWVEKGQDHLRQMGAAHRVAVSCVQTPSL